MLSTEALVMRVLVLNNECETFNVRTAFDVVAAWGGFESLTQNIAAYFVHYFICKERGI